MLRREHVCLYLGVFRGVGGLGSERGFRSRLRRIYILVFPLFHISPRSSVLAPTVRVSLSGLLSRRDTLSDPISMAYHQAPQHDLPGVTVSSPGYSHDTHYRAPGVYDTSYTHHPKPPAGYGFPRDDTGRALPSYKPPQLRWFFLGIVVLVILGYVALTEYALQVLPRESGRGEISSYTELEGRLGAEVSAALTSETSVSSTMTEDFFLC